MNHEDIASVARGRHWIFFVLDRCFSNSCASGPFCLLKITTDPHILHHVSLEWPDERYPKLDIYISEPILDNRRSLAYLDILTVITK